MTVFNAKAVLRDGTPEEIKSVQQGQAAVSQVARKALIRVKSTDGVLSSVTESSE
jgi:hypothetical protein